MHLVYQGSGEVRFSNVCSIRSVPEVMRFLTFAFSITKYSHAEELQHPDRMMNSLNQPQDVTVSTGLCLD